MIVFSPALGGKMFVYSLIFFTRSYSFAILTCPFVKVSHSCFLHIIVQYEWRFEGDDRQKLKKEKIII